jgi:hypothetical protein
VVSIRDSLSGGDLAVVSVPSGDIGSSYGWVSCDFSDIDVTIGGTYYIVISSPGSSSTDHYKVGFAAGNPYGLGSLWYSYNSGVNWLEYAVYDFTFRTYGII